MVSTSCVAEDLGDLTAEEQADDDPELAAAIRLSLMPPEAAGVSIDSAAAAVLPAEPGAQGSAPAVISTGEDPSAYPPRGPVNDPTLEEVARETDAEYQRLGEDYIRRLHQRGGRQVATAIKCPRATLWLSGAEQITGDFLSTCSAGALVITAMRESPAGVVKACSEAKLGPPIAFPVAYVPVHRARIWDVLEQVFAALNGGRDVVIHCHAGVHRAASLVLVVIMLGFGAPLSAAREFLERIRPAVDIAAVFQRAGCDNEGRSLDPDGSDHFLLCYDQLVTGESPQTPEWEAWLHAHCRLYAAEGAGPGQNPITAQLPLVATDPARPAGVSPGLRPFRGGLVKALEIPEGEDFWDDALGVHVSCLVCSGRYGSFIKCSRCASWIHFGCWHSDDVFCGVCGDQDRQRDDQLKRLQRQKRFGMEAARAKAAAGSAPTADAVPSGQRRAPPLNRLTLLPLGTTSAPPSSLVTPSMLPPVSNRVLTFRPRKRCERSISSSLPIRSSAIRSS